MKEYYDKLDKLKEYMDIYIQLSDRVKTVYRPTFEYFCKYYNDLSYSLIIPHYKESYDLNPDLTIRKIYTQGIESEEGIGFRYYNYWMTHKYFIPNKKEFVIKTDYLERIFKTTLNDTSSTRKLY